MTDIVFWQALEAIGTLFAVIIALFLGLLPNLKSWLNRPIIKVDVQEKTLYEQSIWQYWLLVTNKGKTTAQAVNITIEKIVQNGKPIDNGYPGKRDSRIERLNDPI